MPISMTSCPIWGTSAEVTAQPNGFWVVSDRAGGQYGVSVTTAPLLGKLSEHKRAKLTTWLVNERRAGNERPFFDIQHANKLGERRPLTVSERKEMLFRCLADVPADLKTQIKISGQVDREYHYWRYRLGAWTESKTANVDDIGVLIGLLEDDNLLRSAGQYFLITSQGWSYLDSLKSRNSPSKQVFVAMWFSADMDEIYSVAIEKAVEAAGYVPRRIDRKEHNNKIDDEIIAEIRGSRFLIADFTAGMESGTHVPRGGVYYEAGFARGLGLEVIHSVRSDQIGSVHFDTRQISHVVWETADDLAEKLYNRIIATIGHANAEA